MTALVAIHNATYTYPGADTPALHHVEFTLDQGRNGLVGPNGSGKTTLVHAIMGLIRLQSGEIRYEGGPVADEKDFMRLRKGVGFVFQNPDDQLFSPTVIEDVAFGPLNLGKSPTEARDIGLATLARLGLDGFADRVTHRLSGGEKRLVALATILAMEPKALILDEPTNDLDPDTRARLVGLLKGLDLPFLVISHDWDFLDMVVDRLFRMQDGHLTEADREALHQHTHLHTGGDVPHRHGNLNHK